MAGFDGVWPWQWVRENFHSRRNFPGDPLFKPWEAGNTMAFTSLKSVFARAELASPEQLESWSRSWRAASDNGGTEPRLVFFAREAGLTEEAFLQRLAGSLGWPFVELKGVTIPPEASRRISTKVAFQHLALPIAVDNGVLRVAVSDPFDSGMLGAVQFEAKGPVEFVLAPRAEIEKSLKKYYGVGAETLDEMSEEEPIDIEIGDSREITGDDQEASVIKFVNQVIWEAYKDRATDIHFEPSEDELRIRYRIDGILHQTPLPPQIKRYQAALISRIKVMSGMNIAEKRLPQDGRINVRIKGEEIDIRVSTVPTVWGESVSLRLLTRGKIFFGLDRLGFAADEEAAIRDLIVKPHGIFLVTGPTGSGKSTSLYAFLSSINSVTKRIITIEDPVEYELKGINQIPVRADIGLTFAVGLRHILRQDPNVVMVGEIRDLETAEIAIRASLTGHLVFSTLHTNDAPSAFTRLIDMGIEPFLVASSVEAVMAQRLVRTICSSCKTRQTVDRDYLIKAGFPAGDIDSTQFLKGMGCEECRQLGYQGRTGIHELLVMSEAIRPMVMNRAPATTIAGAARAAGMRTLREDGWRKVKLGVTTIEEVVRVTQTEEYVKGLTGVEKAGGR